MWNVEVPGDCMFGMRDGAFASLYSADFIVFKRRALSKLKGYKRKKEVYSLFLKCIFFMMTQDDKIWTGAFRYTKEH